MIRKITILSFVAWVLTGCVAGQHLKMDHNPTEKRSTTTEGAVVVDVTDDRSYVLNRDKEDYYIGHYRAGFGNTWDVTTFKKVPLKDQIKSDLVEELNNMGFTNSSAEKTLSISIVEWNFDAFQNGKFWYEIIVNVIGKNGNVVATEKLKNTIIIKGTVMTGAKGGFEREMPGHYDNIINSIVRGNAGILKALKSSP